MSVKKFVGKILYNVIAKKLPGSNGKFTFGSKKMRAFCGQLLLKECGKNINIETGAEFGSEISLGDFSGIGVNALLTGPISIGKNVMMGPDCMMFTVNHTIKDTNIPMMCQGFEDPKPIIIEDDVWIGARVIILPGVHVGKGSVIGAGSIVTHDIEPYSIVGGNPAKLIRKRNKN